MVSFGEQSIYVYIFPVFKMPSRKGKGKRSSFLNKDRRENEPNWREHKEKSS